MKKEKADNPDQPATSQRPAKKAGDFDFDPRLFTHVFWKLRKCDKRFVINFGSSASSKSWSQAQHEVIRCLEEPQRIAICRKYQNWITKSVWQLVRTEVLAAWGIPFEENRTEREIYLPNGSTILFMGLDNPEKVKGLENVQRAWIEEANQLTEEDFDMVNLRMRSKKHTQVSLTFNPISKYHWLKERFFGEGYEFESPREDTDVVHSNFKQNPHLTEQYREQMEWYRIHDFSYYWTYGLGNWGEPQTGYEFYHGFTSGNITNTKYDPNNALHLSFDFNRLPYNTCTIWQVVEEGDQATVYQIDEVCATDPHNNTEDTTKIVARKYSGHRGKVFIYGDPAGRAKDSRSKGGRNDYSIIFSVLRGHDFSPIDMVRSAPPDINDRGAFMNACFRGGTSVHIYVDETCTRSIEDFRTVKTTLEGKKEKRKEKDQKTGLQMELRGHTSDSADYFICSAFMQAFNRYLFGGQPPRRGGKKASAGKNKL